MANVNVDLKNASGKYAFKKFRGVDQTVISSDELFAQECVNFRVMSDGTLKKRCGFERIGNLPDKIRTFWTGYVTGVKRCFALAGQNIYNVDLTSDSYTAVGTVDTSVGKAEFFTHNGGLYLLDGESIYAYNGSEFKKTIGYIPLYGDGWSTVGMGDVKEPVNCLSPYVRLKYSLISDGDLNFRFPWPVESIYKLYVDGVQCNISCVQIASNQLVAMMQGTGAKKGSVVLLYVKIANFKSLFPSEICNCKSSVVYGLADNTRLFLYNSNKTRRIYYSTRVSPMVVDNLREQEPDASALYFLQESYFDVGERDGGITSMCTYDDKLFIFTGTETWYTLCDTVTQLPAAQISGEIGCVGAGATSAVPGGVVTVMPTGVYRLTVSGSAKNVFSYKKISDPISDSVDASYLELAKTHYCGSRGEIWLSAGDGYSDKVWIYDSRGNWFCFDSVKNKGFCEVDGDVGFWNDSQIFAFREDRLYDADPKSGENKEIIAMFKSKPIDFSHPERKKKLLWATLQASTGDELIELELFGDGGGHESFEFMGDSSKMISSFSCRPRVGRFKYAQVGVNVGKSPRVRVVGITLAVSGL